MLFNSLEFALFLPTVFILYWFVFNKTLKLQNFFLFLVSYVFYAWWDWRFLVLIAFSTLTDFFTGILLEQNEDEKKRKIIFTTSLLINLCLLGFFKYFNFFVDSFIQMFSTVGITLQATTLNIILPVGISFYTFQSITYTYAVYKRNMKPTRDIITFFAYVSFFPQLVAGPIERATHFLPQFLNERKFDYVKATDGLRQILWGLFKKIVIADNLAPFVNDIFANYETLPGSTLLYGVMLFAIQIYGDFSGYTDIAIGTPRLFGFELAQNFNFPYFSKNLTTFWRKWHISLTSWFTEYLYTPIVIKKRDWGNYATLFGIFVTFGVSGLWHGAKWTFIIWGLMHGIGLSFEFLTKKQRKKWNKNLPPLLLDIVGGTITFLFVCISYIFFRAESIKQATGYFANIFSSSLFTMPNFSVFAVGLIIPFMFIEYLQRKKVHSLQIERLKSPFVRWTIYVSVCFITLFFSKSEVFEFIYFQF